MVQDAHARVRPNLGAGGPAFLISLAGQPCGCPVLAFFAKAGGDAVWAMLFVMPRPASLIRRSPSPRSLIKTGDGRIGDEGDHLRFLNPPQRDSQTISQKGERSPHFLAFLLSRFLAFPA